MSLKHRLPALALTLVLSVAVVWAAIDSRNKRASANNAGASWTEVLPNPDGTIDQADRAQVTKEYSGFTYSEPPVSSFDLTGLPLAGDWEPWVDILALPEFITLKRQECDGDGVWAAWLAGTSVTPRGSANCVVDVSLIRQEADNVATWARWSPGTTNKGSANLQIDIRAAFTDDFVPN